MSPETCADIERRRLAGATSADLSALHTELIRVHRESERLMRLVGRELSDRRLG